MSHPIGQYTYAPATVVQSDPRAADVAEYVATLIRSRCPQVEVEHVGSTSIPACAGKGIIDMMAVYPDGMLVSCRSAIDGLGFQPQTFGEPFPETRPMRVGVVTRHGRAYRVHVHVLAASSDEVPAIRAFRDRLRGDPSLVRAYVDRKLDLVDAGVVRSPDYALAKGGFIRAVLSSDPATAA